VSALSETFLAVDVGLRGCGVAIFGGSPVFAEKKLLRAGYVKNTVKRDRGAPAWAAMAQEVLFWTGREVLTVVETHRFRFGAPHELKRIPDILEVQGCAGAIAALCSGDPLNVVGYTPEQWKGSVPKDQMCTRILNCLSLDEFGAQQDGLPISTEHNMIDAIGIGLHHCGRLHTRKIFRGGD
jgi:hypothetical protein